MSMVGTYVVGQDQWQESDCSLKLFVLLNLAKSKYPIPAPKHTARKSHPLNVMATSMRRKPNPTWTTCVTDWTRCNKTCSKK